MKKILYIITVFSLLFFYSCDDYLDNQPKGNTIPEYFEDFAFLLNDFSLGFFGAEYPAFLTDDAELADKDVPTSVNYLFKRENEQAVYSFENGDIFPEGFNDGFYSDGYSAIFTYNVVANNILDVVDGTEKDKKEIHAEAVTHRANIYLQLVNVYAKHYDKTTADTDLGVPIILDEDITIIYERNSVAEVYDLIISDLNEVVENLSEITSNSFHPSKASGYGLLARTYLYMGEYELALQSAIKALESNKTSELLDYTEFILNPDSPWNRITDRNGMPFPQRHSSPENMYVKLAPIGLSGSIFASKDLLEVFEQNLGSGAIDKRRELFYADDEVINYGEQKFLGYTMFIPGIMPNLGVTLQEIYLILAECEARVPNGSIQQALAYLDVLRDKRIVGNTPLMAASKEEALQIALDERRREMAFWGSMRYIDLKRLNKEAGFAKDVVHKLGEQTFTLPANDPRYVMPLPHNLRELNPSIPQYER